MTVKQSNQTTEIADAAGDFVLDFEAPGYLADPYPHLHALRDRHPVFLSPWGDWYLTRFADVSTVLTDRRFQRQSPAGANPISGAARDPTAIDRMLSRWMVFIDPPVHTRLRRLVGKAFTPKLVAAMRGDIGDIAGYAEIQIMDTGIGIDPENLERLLLAAHRRGGNKTFWMDKKKQVFSGDKKGG